MTEYEKARQWRIDRGLSVQRLSELSGYSPEAIYFFERGRSSTKGSEQPPPQWAWQRYRNVCAGLDAQIRSGVNFNWGE